MNKREIEKAIEELKYQEDMRGKGISYQVDNLVINTAISALEQQLNGGWILCEDRMPNVDNIMVLIQDKYGNLALAIYKDGNFYFLNHTNTMLIKGSKIKNVVAWHFLPKPWEDNNDE